MAIPEKGHPNPKALSSVVIVGLIHWTTSKKIRPAAWPCKLSGYIGFQHADSWSDLTELLPGIIERQTGNGDRSRAARHLQGQPLPKTSFSDCRSLAWISANIQELTAAAVAPTEPPAAPKTGAAAAPTETVAAGAATGAWEDGTGCVLANIA